ncbi:MAG: glycosyltransferase family 2 protein [Armatimonadota bacterium]
MRNINDLVSLIIVNYNKRPYTELCLSSLLKSTYEPVEFILVDNGSTDGTRDVLDDFGRQCSRSGIRCEVILNDDNVGACTARNQAMNVAAGNYIAFMDNDTAVRTANWLEILRGVLDEDESNGICGPKLLFPFEPYDIECAGVEISQNGWPRYRGRGAACNAPEFNLRCEMQALISAVWLMKADLTDDIGVLDEVFNPAQFEDLDYCYRAREAGYRVFYEPAAEMYHFENVTTDGSVDVNFKYVTIKNGMEFKRRWRHMFSKEGGPPDSETRWLPLETRPLEVTGVPPIIYP